MATALPSSVSKKKKTKIYYQHGKDALGLALSVANMQEEKALRKAEKRHHLQAGKPRSERKHHARDKRNKLEETKDMIAKRRAEAKKERARSRKQSRKRDDSKLTAPEVAIGSAPRKKVSFA